MSTIEELIEKLAIGNIYWFKNPQINSPDSHPHIYVGRRADDYIFLICCTSQFEKRRRYFELNELPFETLVRLKDSKNNNLTKRNFRRLQ